MLGEKVEKLDKVIKITNGGDGGKKKGSKLRVLSPSVNSHLELNGKNIFLNCLVSS